jgi:hypothetical protein
MEDGQFRFEHVEIWRGACSRLLSSPTTEVETSNHDPAPCFPRSKPSPLPASFPARPEGSPVYKRTSGEGLKAFGLLP